MAGFFAAVMTFYKTSHFRFKEILPRAKEKFKEEKSRKGTRTLCNWHRAVIFLLYLL